MRPMAFSFLHSSEITLNYFFLMGVMSARRTDSLLLIPAERMDSICDRHATEINRRFGSDHFSRVLCEALVSATYRRSESRHFSNPLVAIKVINIKIPSSPESKP